MKPTRFVNVNLNDLKIFFNFLITSTPKKILHPLIEFLKETGKINIKTVDKPMNLKTPL